VAVGAGAYLMATITTAVTLVVLAVLPPVEAYFDRRARQFTRRRDDPTS
jgi:uncharacterized membrane protein YhiD involved in acid resistance